MNDLTPSGAAAVRLAATVGQLRRERDRARDVAVALEQRLARVEALTEDLWRVAPCGCGHRADLHTADAICIGGLTLCKCRRSFSSLVTERLRAALGVDA